MMSQLLCFKYEVFSPAPALSSSTVLSHTEQSTTRNRAWQVSTPTPGSVPPARLVSCSSPCSGQALTALQYPPDPQTSRYLDPRHRRQKVAGGPGAAAAQLSSERGAGRALPGPATAEQWRVHLSEPLRRRSPRRQSSVVHWLLS